MAGSRLELIGTIFSRTTGLLRTNAIKYEDRPIWYDAYRIFPPKFEPRADREPVLGDSMTQEVPNILYSEDIDRAAASKKQATSMNTRLSSIGGAEESPRSYRERGKRPVVTVDTLLSMFQKAKGEDEQTDK